MPLVHILRRNYPKFLDAIKKRMFLVAYRFPCEERTSNKELRLCPLEPEILLMGAFFPSSEYF